MVSSNTQPSQISWTNLTKCQPLQIFELDKADLLIVIIVPTVLHIKAVENKSCDINITRVY